MEFKKISPILRGITLALILYNCVQVKSFPYGGDPIGWAHITLYQHENHQGKKYHQEVGPRCYNLPKVIDDEASSVHTHHRCVKVCSRKNCEGNCVEMAPGTAGHYALREIGLNDAISSITPCYDYIF